MREILLAISLLLLLGMASAEIQITPSMFDLQMNGGETEIIDLNITNTSDGTQLVSIVATIFNISGDTNGFETIFSEDQFELEENELKTISFTITTLPNIQAEKYTISIMAFATSQVIETITETIYVDKEVIKYVSTGDGGSTRTITVFKDRNVYIEVPIELDFNRIFEDPLVGGGGEYYDNSDLLNEIKGLEQQLKEEKATIRALKTQNEPFKMTTSLLIALVILLSLASIGVIGLLKIILNKIKEEKIKNKKGDEKKNDE